MGSVFGTPSYPVVKRRNKQVELALHKAVVGYIRRRYPFVLFRTDGGGLKLTKGQAIQYRGLQHGAGWPDLFIAYPGNGTHGLFIELKQAGTSIYKKIGTDKGQLVADEHIRQQANVLEQLKGLGYAATFAVGLDEAITIIDSFMGVTPDDDAF